MSLQDYKNRKYDYLAFQNVDASKEARLGLALYDEDTSGQICTGIQKLAQRWALEFMTERGSMTHLPKRGCEFLTLVRQGRFRSTADITSAFAAVGLIIEQNLKNEEYADMPDDERFESAELAQALIQPGFVELRVLVISRAGEARPIIMPIATLP